MHQIFISNFVIKKTNKMRIFLIGYMGSGKTTIGKLVARKLNYNFIDMDAYIETKQFKTISQIFAEQGEEKFRLLEQKYLQEVAEFNNVVISTGGGAPCFFDNIKYMNNNGLTIYLKYSAEELAQRLGGTNVAKRPVLGNRQGNDLIQFIAEGLAKREEFYSQASHFVSGDITSEVNQVCELVNAKE